MAAEEEQLDEAGCERSVYEELNRNMAQLSAEIDAERGRNTITMAQYVGENATWLARYEPILLRAGAPANALMPTAAVAHAMWTHPVSRHLRVRLLPLCVAHHTITFRLLCRTLGECGCVNQARYATCMPQFANIKGSNDYGSGWPMPPPIRIGTEQAYDVPIDLVAGYWVRVLVAPERTGVRLVRMALFATRPPVKDTLELLEERERKKREKLGAV